MREMVSEWSRRAEMAKENWGLRSMQLGHVEGGSMLPSKACAQRRQLEAGGRGS